MGADSTKKPLHLAVHVAPVTQGWRRQGGAAAQGAGCCQWAELAGGGGGRGNAHRRQVSMAKDTI